MYVFKTQIDKIDFIIWLEIVLRSMMSFFNIVAK